MSKPTSHVSFTEVSLQGKTLTPEQLAFFNDNGYLILPGFLNEQEVEAIASLRDSAVARATEKGGSFFDGTTHYDMEKLKSDPTGKTLGLRKIQGVFQAESTYRDIFSQARVLDVIEDLIGPNIYYHSSKLMCKPGDGGRRKPWHQDFAYWSTMNPKQVTMWVAIDAATLENGCIQVIPGSHKRGLIEHSHLEDFQIDEGGIGQEKIVYAEMKPGDALIFSVLTLHASDPNLSPNSRLGAIIDYDCEPVSAENNQYGSTTPLRGGVAQVQ